MTRARLTPAEIAGIAADHEAGVPIAVIRERYNVATQTVYHHVRARSDNELTGGQWRIDSRRRVQVWVPDPVVMHPSEWRQIQDGAA